MFAVTWLFGANYFLMFGLSVVDHLLPFGDSSQRLSQLFVDYQGVSPIVLAYIWVGFMLFVVGYNMQVGQKLAELIDHSCLFMRDRSRFVGARRFFVYSLLLFGITFPVMVLAVQRFGAGRVMGSEDFDPSASGQYVAGEVCFIIYALGVWRFMLSKQPGSREMPRGFGIFVWGGMFALQVGFSVWLGSRTRLMTVLLTAVMAYHYAYRPIKGRAALLGGVLAIGVVLPAVAFQRDAPEDRPPLDSVSSVIGWGWDSMTATRR
jgi:hypothetical protein